MIGRFVGLLPGATLLFVAALYLLPSEPAAADVFYVSVLPCLLASLWRARGRLPADRAATLLTFGLIAWSGLTLVWGHDDKHRTAKFAWETVMTACFLAAVLQSASAPGWRARLRSVLVAAGAANAALAMALFFLLPQPGPRLTGWGVTTNAILGADAMLLPYLAALWRACSGREMGPRTRVLHLAAAAVMAGFVLLTESRGPLLAGLAATLFICAAGRWRARALAGLAGAVLIWALLPAAVHRHQAAVLVERGSSHRFEIWRDTLRLIGERPLLGHGLASNLGVPEATFPHDLYLSVLFYSGVGGFALFLGVLGVAAARAWQERGRSETVWTTSVLGMALVAGLTDFGQITKGPGPVWMVFWLPVCLLCVPPPWHADDEPSPGRV